MGSLLESTIKKIKTLGMKMLGPRGMDMILHQDRSRSGKECLDDRVLTMIIDFYYNSNRFERAQKEFKIIIYLNL